MIYGCDIGSRRVALACPETGYLAKLRLPVRGKSDPARDVPLLGAWLKERTTRHDHMYLESPYVGRGNLNQRTAILLGIVAGGLVASNLGLTEFVAQATWKKEVIGHGNADKAAIRSWLDEHHPSLAKACEDDQDLYDAACLGLYGGLLASKRLEEPSPVQQRKPRPVLRSRGKAADAPGAGGRGARLVQ